MSVILETDTFNPANIYYVQNVKNNVKQNSYFSRIIYSTDHFSLKNIYFSFNLMNPTFKEQYLKTIIYFNEKDCQLDKLYKIEREFLEKYIEYKTFNRTDEKLIPNYSIFNQCKSNSIKVFKNNATNNNNKTIEILIKISGIWQTDNNIGITYKFI